MPISKITAMAIGTRDDIVTAAAGPDESGKYSGWITLGVDDHFRPLLSSECIYDSEEAAKKTMDEIVAEIREQMKKELGDKHPIDHIMGEGPEAEAVKKVIGMARGTKP
jgi:hypothetical protein